MAVVNSPVIFFDGVSKHYRHTGAGITDITLEVGRGQVFGFLGPNGAGKTTTIRLMLDLIRPDAGSISLLGFDSRRDGVALRRSVGYVPGELALYERLTGREFLSHFAYLRGGLPWSQIEPLVDRFDLTVDQPIRSLSKGNKQKVGLIQALMGDPQVLVLDEPTSGLDPLMQKQVHDHLHERAEAGTTVFLSSHALGEVASVARRVGIIRDGRLIAVDDVDVLRERAVHRLEARFAAPPPPEAFARLAGIRHLEIDGNDVRMELSGSMDAVIKAVARFEVLDLSVREPSLEEVFLTYYGTDQT
jgi:ABC-2 type transport system ATP-binding protein